jgi:hypothetical protein
MFGNCSCASESEIRGHFTFLWHLHFVLRLKIGLAVLVGKNLGGTKNMQHADL